MASTRFYLDLRGNAKDGKGSVLLSIFHNRTTSTIPTGVRIYPTEWDGIKVIHKSDSSIINAKLSKLKYTIDDNIAKLSITESFESLTATELKHLVYSKDHCRNRQLVSVLFEEYLKHSLAEGTKEIYISALNKVLAFGGQNLKITSITVKWLYDFDIFLSKTQKSANGRSMYMRCLRAVCKYAYKTGCISSCPFDLFQIKSEPTRKRCIEIKLFRKFMTFPTSEKNSLYRDYFMLLFYLIGINCIDLLTAKKNNIINGRLEYDRKKTHKHYSIKIEPEAQAIIDKHLGQGEYLLDALDHCVHPKSFMHQMNDALKTIGTTIKEEIPDQNNLFGSPVTKETIIPIIPGISSYYARHSWATFAADLDISSDIIAQALGHSNGNRTTMIYIKPNRSKVDEANRRVIDFVLKEN